MFNDIQGTAETFETPKPTPDFRMMVNKMSADMSFTGTFIIVYGALTCLSIVGALIGVPLIFAGLRLRKSAESFKIFKNSYGFDSLKSGLEMQARFFRINKNLIIISIILMAVYFLAMLLLLLSRM